MTSPYPRDRGVTTDVVGGADLGLRYRYEKRQGDGDEREREKERRREKGENEKRGRKEWDRVVKVITDARGPLKVGWHGGVRPRAAVGWVGEWEKKREGGREEGKRMREKIGENEKVRERERESIYRVDILWLVHKALSGKLKSGTN